MNTLLEQLPKAAYWSFVSMIVMIVSVLFTLLGLPNETGKEVLLSIFSLVMGIWQIFLFRAYNKACKAAIDSGNTSDVELACLQQMKIIRLLGVLMLLAIVFGSLWLFAVLVSLAGH